MRQHRSHRHYGGGKRSECSMCVLYYYDIVWMVALTVPCTSTSFPARERLRSWWVPAKRWSDGETKCSSGAAQFSVSLRRWSIGKHSKYRMMYGFHQLNQREECRYGSMQAKNTVRALKNVYDFIQRPTCHRVGHETSA